MFMFKLTNWLNFLNFLFNLKQAISPAAQEEYVHTSLTRVIKKVESQFCLATGKSTITHFKGEARILSNFAFNELVATVD